MAGLSRGEIAGVAVCAALGLLAVHTIRQETEASANVDAIESVGELVADDANHEIKRVRRATAAAAAEGKTYVLEATGADTHLDDDLVARHAAGIVGVRDAASADRNPEGSDEEVQEP